MKTIMKFAVTVALALSLPFAASAAGDAKKAPLQDWSFNGPLGEWDQDQLQRGFLVFQRACANCHTLNYLEFKDLTGIGFSEDEIKAIISFEEYEVMGEPDEEGEVAPRLARLSDKWPAPFANDKAAAAANNGKAPPDLTLMAKARPGGPDYVYALLKGYVAPTGEALDAQLKEWDIPAFDANSQHLNTYFPGHVIAMPAPLTDGAVDYVDGTPADVKHYAQDVTAFLMWTADPYMMDRKRMGIKVLIFLGIFSIFAWFAFKNAARRAKADQAKNGGPWGGH